MTKFHFVAKVESQFVHNGGTQGSRLDNTIFDLDPSYNLKRDIYKTKDNLLTQEGLKMFTATLVSGIIASTVYGKDQGFFQGEDHLEYIVREISRLYRHTLTQTPEMAPGTFSDGMEGDDVVNIEIEEIK